jgi:hypothetical protein
MSEDIFGVTLQAVVGGLILIAVGGAVLDLRFGTNGAITGAVTQWAGSLAVPLITGIVLVGAVYSLLSGVL